MPSRYEDYWQAWHRQHPNFTFRTWRDSDIDESFLIRKKLAEAKGMSSKADIASYEILYKYGGIYLDCDVMPYHYLDWEKVNADLIVCNEAKSDEFCSLGFVAASPSNRVFKRAIDTLSDMPLNAQPPNVETGPYFFRRMIASDSHVMLPTNAFYPYGYNEPFVSILERNLAGTYGIHVWRGSWITTKQRVKNILRRLRWGDLSEAVSLAGDVDPEIRELIESYADEVTKTRRSYLSAIGHAASSLYLKVKSTVYFEFLKCAFYILSKDRDAVIWQIGADAIHADPLRPIAINFDPRIVILETDPCVLESLQRSYAKNKNIQFICGSLGRTSSEPQLRRIRPDEIESESAKWASNVPVVTNRQKTEVEKRSSELMSVAELLALTGNRSPNVVLIETDDISGKILDCVQASGIRPQIIQYKQQFREKTGPGFLPYKLGHEYVHVFFENHVVLYRSDFLEEYCEELFVQHGIPTIYEEGLKSFVGR